MAVVQNMLFRKSLKDAYKGRKLLKQIILRENVDLNMDFIILLPEVDKECNFNTLLYLNQLVRQFEEDKDRLEKKNIHVFRNNEKFIILTMDSRVEKLAVTIFNRTTKVIMLSMEEIECLMKRYTFMEFSRHHFIVASFNQPSGRQCKGLINSKKASQEELIAVGMLGVRYNNFMRWEKPAIPRIILKDKELYSFMYEH